MREAPNTFGEAGTGAIASHSLGIVAIGRNEGERLRACLTSVVSPGRTVVYVDSGSSDGSVDLARSLGVEVVELDTAIGFTAARARNTGLQRLLTIKPEVEYVQFVDSDCEIVAGWIEKAVAFLAIHPEVVVVCGRRREIDPGRNVYHRLVDMEWDTPVGEAKSCGGDALFRVTLLQECGGYRETLIAGEEPELCVRLRAAGWKIHRLPEEMTRHDVRISSWRQWWKRSLRAGHAFAEGAALHGGPPERHWVRETRSALIWGFILPVMAIILAWPTSGLSVVAAAALYALLLVKTSVSYRKQGCGWGRAVLYGLNCVAAKLPQFFGATLYYWRSLRGARSHLVEYRPSDKCAAFQSHSK